MIILHCIEKKLLQEETALHQVGANAIKNYGYIPCMKITDINSENFSFPSTKDFVVICISTDKLTSGVKYELNKNGLECPNIYGTINPEAIITEFPYTFDKDDKFIFSDDFADLITVNKLLSILNVPLESFKRFRDGTYSRITLLNNKFLIRKNIPKLLESEVLFSNNTFSDKLQHVVYADDNYEFIVCDFIPGDVMHTIDDIDDLIKNIKEIIDSYSDYEGDEFGYIYEPIESWETFLKTVVHERSLTLPESFNYLPQVYDAIATLKNYPFTKKLIHGDFGTHNFIKQDGKFVAAIDPIPMAGDSLYDLIYALVSNVELLPHLSLEYISEISGEDIEKVKAMLTVVLFCRFSLCLHHHKDDIDSYVDFWYKTVETNE